MRAFLLMLTTALTIVAAAADLPPAAKRQLNRNYPAWKWARAAPQISAWFADYRLPYQPNRIAADFDGDGKTDYAVRIEAGGQTLTLALLDRGGRFEKVMLSTDPIDAFTYLLLYKKGEKDFDFTRLKPFRHAHDAIGLMYFDKTPLTFRYIEGAFQKMLSPSDEELEQ